MIKPDLKYTKNLQEFYQEIKNKQTSAHGIDYIAHHQALINCAKESKTIKEIGVCQGATLACLLLTNPEKLTGIDIMPKYFEPYKTHFINYSLENNIDFSFQILDSTDPASVSEVDLLHIDSLHTPDHLMKELKLHAPHVKKYIVFHDTANFKNAKGLFQTIAQYITFIEQEWKIFDHFIHNVGYTVIKRETRRIEQYNK
jgi:hypothetical protein